MDPLVRLLLEHAHRIQRPKRSEELLRDGLAIADVRDRADIADRLADLCEDQGRNEEAREFRKESKRAAARVQQTLDIHADGHVLGQKTC